MDCATNIIYYIYMGKCLKQHFAIMSFSFVDDHQAQHPPRLSQFLSAIHYLFWPSFYWPSMAK